LRNRPWRIGSAVTGLASEMQACVERLKALDPPEGDRAALELHFLDPMQAEVDQGVAAISRMRRDLRQLRLRTAFRHLDEFDAPPRDLRHRDWCIEYGLEPVALSTRSWFTGPAAGS
jgi:hypothetical protein